MQFLELIKITKKNFKPRFLIFFLLTLRLNHLTLYVHKIKLFYKFQKDF